MAKLYKVDTTFDKLVEPLINSILKSPVGHTQVIANYGRTKHDFLLLIEIPDGCAWLKLAEASLYEMDYDNWFDTKEEAIKFALKEEWQLYTLNALVFSDAINTLIASEGVQEL